MLWYIVLIGIVCIDFLLEHIYKHLNNTTDSKQKSKWEKILDFVFKYRIITIATLIFYSTFKSYSLGLDTRIYIKYYNSLKQNKSLLFIRNISNRFEVGYAFLNSILALINANFRVLLFIISTFVSVVLMLFINKISSNKLMSIILYIALGVFAQSMNTYRQIIAIVFIMLAIMVLIDKKWLKALILIALASIFHISAVVCIVIVPLRFIKPRWWLVVALFACVVVASIIFPYILKFVEMISPLDYYTKYYIELNIYIVESDMLNTLYSISLIIVFLVFYICRLKLLKLEENDRSLYDFFLLIFMFVPLFRVAGFIVNMPQLFNRLNMYFFMILIVLIPLFVKGLIHNKKLYTMAKVGMYVVAICFMTYLYVIKNSCGVYPFEFVF